MAHLTRDTLIVTKEVAAVMWPDGTKYKGRT